MSLTTTQPPPAAYLEIGEPAPELQPEPEREPAAPVDEASFADIEEELAPAPAPPAPSAPRDEASFADVEEELARESLPPPGPPGAVGAQRRAPIWRISTHGGLRIPVLLFRL